MVGETPCKAPGLYSSDSTKVTSRRQTQAVTRRPEGRVLFKWMHTSAQFRVAAVGITTKFRVFFLFTGFFFFILVSKLRIYNRVFDDQCFNYETF